MGRESGPSGGERFRWPVGQSYRRVFGQKLAIPPSFSAGRSTPCRGGPMASVWTISSAKPRRSGSMTSRSPSRSARRLRRRRSRSPAAAALRGLSRRSPVLRLEPHRMVVSYPSLLTEPLVIDRDDVVVAAVDTRRREGGETLRFPFSHEFEWTQPFPGDEAETYGWLYVRNARSPLPFLCDVQSLPNVVVVFRSAARAARLPPPQARRAPAASPASPRPPGAGLLRARPRRGCGPQRPARLGRDAPADGLRRRARRPAGPHARPPLAQLSQSPTGHAGARRLGPWTGRPELRRGRRTLSDRESTRGTRVPGGQASDARANHGNRALPKIVACRLKHPRASCS